MRCLHVVLVFLSGIVFFCRPVMADSKSIRESIVKELSSTAALGPYEVTIDVRQGVVKLFGNVASEADREIVETVSSKTKGVIGVDNYLKVSETLGTGTSRAGTTGLAADIRRALDEQPNLRQETVGIDVKGGTVTLYGEATSDQARGQIETVTRKLAGVREVQNQIVVRGKLSDEALARRVRETLSREYDIDLTDISISARAGVVTFKGSKNNHREIDRILSVCLMVEGVTDVKSEMLIGAHAYR